MKKKPQSWEKNYAPLILFKENVEEIINIVTSQFKQSNSQHKDPPNRIDIQVSQYELEGGDELAQISEAIIKYLRIVVEPGRLSINLSSEEADLIVESVEDTQAMGVATRIDEILQKRKRLGGFFTTNFGSMLLSVSFGLLFWGYMFLIPYHWFKLTLLVTFTIIWACGGLCFLYFKFHYTTIYLFDSKDKQGFFKRNKDAILINLISAFFGFVLGILSTLLILWISNKLKA